jgi:hypothetical protein
MADEKTQPQGNDDAQKQADDDMILLKVPRKDLKMSDEELDKISGGRASSGYGTLDYGTMTSHGGD